LTVFKCALAAWLTDTAVGCVWKAAKADFDRVTGELHRRLAEAVKEKEEVAMQLEGQGQKLRGVVQHAETLKEQCRVRSCFVRGPFVKSSS
jgi:hypothetical protein